MDKKILENFHVLLWLIKDCFWAMELKLFGSLMVIPAVFAAIWIAYLTKGQDEFWVNLAIFFWIIANSTWMLVDFYCIGSKFYSLPFFMMGILAFFRYCIKYFSNSQFGRKY